MFKRRLSPQSLIFFLAALVPFPAAAQAVERPEDAAALAIGSVLLVGLIFLPIVLWMRNQLRQAVDEAARLDTQRARLGEILASAPDGFYQWDLAADGTVLAQQCSRRLAVLLGLYGGIEATYADVRDSFGASEAAVLDVAVTGLQQNGNGFELELGLGEGHRRILVVGSRAADSDGRPLADVLWMRDVTEGAAAVESLSHERSDLGAERDRLRALLDALPLPVWLRDGDLAPVYCNQAYARAVDAASPDEALETGTELVPAPGVREARALAARARASGLLRSDPFHLVMSGARRLVELTEAPFDAGDGKGLMTVGVAVDHTRQEELQNQLERHVAAHAEVLENLGTAIAIFSSDTRLSFFNTAFSLLWQLDGDWLRTEPTFANILDVLREHRRLPEVADYRAFKEAELRLFTSLLEAKETLLHLPDERTLRRTVRPIRSAACCSPMRTSPTRWRSSDHTRPRWRFTGKRSTTCTKVSACFRPTAGCACPIPPMAASGTSRPASSTKSRISANWWSAIANSSPMRPIGRRCATACWLCPPSALPITGASSVPTAPSSITRRCLCPTAAC